MLSLVVFPMICLLFCIVEQAVPVFLGEQWNDIILVLYALIPATLMAATNTAPGWVYLSLGHVERQLKVALITTPIMLCAIALGLQWGTIGVAIAVSLTNTLMKIPTMMIAFHKQPLRLRDFLEPISFGILTSILCGIVTYVACQQIPLGLIPVMGAKVCIFTILYALALFGTPFGRQHIEYAKNMLRLIRP
jgi:PST family polysaccharide transporter